ncbi:alpha/beta hydrolase [Rhodococcus triatomae]|uniref:Alpha/beta hydrolase n=1 Tax=Rhodococcus triatomae TaxID=300028 RepID=A0A1G8MWL8_9NOCA|nr:alpha/beta hydrolase [Rhodococcus triatomae]QNG19111.1 alpha/beta hydrolase [Rhodococcus triatomae]QNG24975.1 alpha/beta hydrolase [Rhodococcus triatomae]SDI72246.1 hypothetical protein SAMN05444695_11099 [Rhodococcus triatomae]
MTTRLVFLHGAGGFLDDRRMADDLAGVLDARLDIPHLPEEDMSFDAWAASIRTSLTAMRTGDLLVAHSFGASILLRVLAERRWEGVPEAVLLAMPNWGPEGWDVEEYAFAGRKPAVALSLHHCRDDEVVPVAHLSLNSASLPSARVTEHASGGHQFDGRVASIAADASGQRRRQGL